MTNQERAKKIVQYIRQDFPLSDKESCDLKITFVTTQLDEAQREAKIEEASYWALAHAKHEKQLEENFTHKGFAAAKEKAVLLAKEHGVYVCDCVNGVPTHACIADRIRKMEP